MEEHDKERMEGEGNVQKKSRKIRGIQKMG